MPMQQTESFVPFEKRLSLRKHPGESPAMYQTWEDLLFLHWRVPPEVAQRWLPAGLTIDTWDQSAWLGIVPFKMREIRFNGLPTLPWISNFLELNVRTYAINAEGVPGVWFLSLDATRWLAVHLARAWFRLPYHHAAMNCERDQQGTFRYSYRRFGESTPPPTEFRWRPGTGVFHAAPDTLEFFLIERYVLFAALGSGEIATGQVHHPPYPLLDAKLESWSEQPLQVNRLEPFGTPPDHVIASPGVHVEIFGLKRPFCDIAHRP